MDLVERVARAIEQGEKRWIGIDPGSPAFCRSAAQAAIAAILQDHVIVPKEPTEAMQEEGENSLIDNRETDYNYDGPCGDYFPPRAAIYIYRAMIEAAPKVGE